MFWLAAHGMSAMFSAKMLAIFQKADVPSVATYEARLRTATTTEELYTLHSDIIKEARIFIANLRPRCEAAIKVCEDMLAHPFYEGPLREHVASVIKVKEHSADQIDTMEALIQNASNVAIHKKELTASVPKRKRREALAEERENLRNDMIPLLQECYEKLHSIEEVDLVRFEGIARDFLRNKTRYVQEIPQIKELGETEYAQFVAEAEERKEQSRNKFTQLEEVYEEIKEHCASATHAAEAAIAAQDLEAEAEKARASAQELQEETQRWQTMAQDCEQEAAEASSGAKEARAKVQEFESKAAQCRASQAAQEKTFADSTEAAANATAKAQEFESRASISWSDARALAHEAEGARAKANKLATKGEGNLSRAAKVQYVHAARDLYTGSKKICEDAKIELTRMYAMYASLRSKAKESVPKPDRMYLAYEETFKENADSLLENAEQIVQHVMEPLDLSVSTEENMMAAIAELQKRTNQLLKCAKLWERYETEVYRIVMQRKHAVRELEIGNDAQVTKNARYLDHAF